VSNLALLTKGRINHVSLIRLAPCQVTSWSLASNQPKNHGSKCTITLLGPIPKFPRKLDSSCICYEPSLPLLAFTSVRGVTVVAFFL